MFCDITWTAYVERLVTIQSPDGLNSVLPFRHLTKKNATEVKLVKIKFFLMYEIRWFFFMLTLSFSLVNYWDILTKSCVINFHTQTSCSQSEERTIFFHVWEKWYVQSKATEECEFRAEIPSFYKKKTNLAIAPLLISPSPAGVCRISWYDYILSILVIIGQKKNIEDTKYWTKPLT